MFKKTLLAALISGAMISVVQAAETQPNGYLFGNLGRADASTPDFVKNTNAEFRDVATGASAVLGENVGFDSSFESKDTAFKIGAGLQLNQHIGIEFQYVDLGEIDYKASFNALGTNLSAGRADASTDGLGLNLVGTLPFDRFKLFGKVGYHKLKTKVRLQSDLFDEYSRDSATEWVTSYGVGASYAFTRAVEVVGEYERYNDVANEYDVDLASIGLRYNF